MLKYFDAHSHLNFPQYNEDRDEVIAGMSDEGVWTITVGTDENTSREAVALSNQHDHLFATVGIHPTDVSGGFDKSVFDEFINETKVAGVGECGLDYFRLEGDVDKVKEKQKEIFKDHIEFALEHNKPLMLHMRPSKNSMDAYEDGLLILNSYSKIHNSKLRGNSHFFVGTTDIAKEFLDLGFTISFDGPVTFTHEYDEVVRYLPLDMILAETDAPYAAPEPFRGKRNEPSYVKYVVEEIAGIRNEEVETVREATVKNTLRIFDIAL